MDADEVPVPERHRQLIEERLQISDGILTIACRGKS
jgi:hypothetical protein